MPTAPPLIMVENRISAPRSTSPILIKNSVRAAAFNQSGIRRTLLTISPRISAQSTVDSPQLAKGLYLPIQKARKASPKTTAKPTRYLRMFVPMKRLAMSVNIRVNMNRYITGQTVPTPAGKDSVMVVHLSILGSGGSHLAMPSSKIRKPTHTAHQSSFFHNEDQSIFPLVFSGTIVVSFVLVSSRRVNQI